MRGHAAVCGLRCASQCLLLGTAQRRVAPREAAATPGRRRREGGERAHTSGYGSPHGYEGKRPLLAHREVMMDIECT